VTQELKKRSELDIVGGAFYISQLTNKVASSANVQFHARIISQKHILRELIRISSETMRDAYDESTDVFDLLDKQRTGNVRHDQRQPQAQLRAHERADPGRH
jgi:replicative DNA helicase